jgi:hypothetical protein
MTKSQRKYPLTITRITDAAAADDNIGFCLTCGAERFNVEPDARRYPCEECGALKVYGAQEMILMFCP